jgi:hypothetical protein
MPSGVSLKDEHPTQKQLSTYEGSAICGRQATIPSMISLTGLIAFIKARI